MKYFDCFYFEDVFRNLTSYQKWVLQQYCSRKKNSLLKRLKISFVILNFKKSLERLVKVFRFKIFLLYTLKVFINIIFFSLFGQR